MEAESFLSLLDNDYMSIKNDLIDLINIPSVSTDLNTVKGALEWYINKAKSYGLNGQIVCDGTVGVIEVGQGTETVGVLVHLDVVDAGNLELWHTDPFSGIETDDWIIGRGSIDDKGPAVMVLAILKCLKESGVSLHKKIQLIVGTQEEVAWTDMDQYVKQFKLPDYGFTPDGEFPILNQEKGYADYILEFKAKDSEPVVVESIASGKSLNSIPDYAKCTLKNGVSIDAVGKSTHSSTPENGINAIETLTSKILPLIHSDNYVKRCLTFIEFYLKEDFYGKKIGILPSDDNFNQLNPIEDTTIAATKLECDRHSCKLYLNLRTRIDTIQDILESKLNRESQKLEYTLNCLQYLAPLDLKSDAPYLQKMASAYESQTQLKNDFLLANGTSYAKAMPNFVAWGPLFPGDEDSCHEANERISKSTLRKATRVYGHFIFDVATSTESYKPK